MSNSLCYRLQISVAGMMEYLQCYVVFVVISVGLVHVVHGQSV